MACSSSPTPSPGYQCLDADVPALMNLSKFSTDAGYRDALTGSELLKKIAEGAELPRPAHLDGSGLLSFYRPALL